MTLDILRPFAARRLAARQMSTMRWVAKADPCTQWAEINARVNRVLSHLPPLPNGLPDQKQGWKSLLREYERRKVSGLDADAPAVDL